MFKVYDGEIILGDMLRKGGIHNFDKLELLPTWTVFKEFVKLPFITENDHIFVEWGTYPRRVERDGKYVRDGEEFSFHLCRQLEEPGEDEFVQVHCRFNYEPNESLQRYGHDDVWWAAYYDKSQEDFLNQIESLAVFQALAKNHKPMSTSMDMGVT